MAIKDLIVIVDDSPGSAARIETAFIMARKYNAHLTAVFAQELELLSDKYVRVFPRTARELAASHVRKMEEETAAEIKAVFRNQVEAANWTAKSTWQMIHGRPDRVASVISRYADHALVGQESKNLDKHRAVNPEENVGVGISDYAQDQLGEIIFVE